MACDNAQKMSESEFLACLGIIPGDPLTNEMQAIAERAGVRPGAEMNYALACMRVRRIMYTKASGWQGITQSNLTGTCDKQDTVSGGEITLGATTGASGITGGAAAIPGLSAGLSTALGVISFGVGLIALPFAFLANHAKAVRVEQSTVCAVVSAYNALADALERSLLTGEIGLGQAEQELVRFREIAIQELSKIRKECNFACGLIHVIDAMVLYNREVLLSKFSSSAPIASQARNFVKENPGTSALIGVGLAALVFVAVT